MAQNCVIYEQCHNIQIAHDGVHNSTRNINIRISKDIYNKIIIKAFEVDNHCFNYTCGIDQIAFRQMKLEQSLEINFDEFQSQLIDLLKETQLEQMYLRFETDATRCKMIFYEKARLKSLIFLTIDLQITDQLEIINEMSKNLSRLKEINRNISYQLTQTNAQLCDKEVLLNTAVSTNTMFANQVKKDVQTLENAFCSTLGKLERKIGEKLVALNRKHVKLINDLEIVKAENKLKCESSVRLVNSMQNLRLENERNIKMIDDLRMEVNHLKILRNNAEENCGKMRQNAGRKEREIDDLKLQIEELRKDLQDATLIIAQKSKTHEELSKDLVQANTMLVNFNNQYDALSKEMDEMREVSKRKDKYAKEQVAQKAKLLEEFERYKTQFNTDELSKVKQELFFTKQNLHELEKQNKEAVKMNGLLTRKLSSGDAVRNVNLLPPSQRNNY